MRKISLAMAALVAMGGACSSSGGQGGAGGGGGSAGLGGSAGSGGTGGSAGTGGTGGLGGMAGSGGQGGQAGQGGQGGEGGSAGSGGQGQQGDGKSCATAFSLTLGSPSNGQIDVAGKRVFYSAAVQAGDFLEVATRANPNNHPDTLDTAVTIFDASGQTRLASMDDSYPRLSSDTEFIYHPAADGTLCFVVEEYSTWAGRTPVARPGDNYLLTVTRVDPTAADRTVDAEPNDSPANAQAGKLGASAGVANVYGTLGTASDVDVYRFTGIAGGTNLHVEMPPLGIPAEASVSGYGSTLRGIAVNVADDSGSVVGAFDPAASGFDASPESIDVPVTAGANATVTVSRPAGGTLGSNDFYATSVYFTGDSPPEGAADDDTQATAEAVTLSSSANPKTTAGYVLGDVAPAASDVDWYSFPAHAGDTLVVACAAQRVGSGLRGATFAIWSASAALQSQTETASIGVYWATAPGASQGPIAIDADGTYYLRVSASSQDPGVASSYYRCGLYLTTP